MKKNKISKFSILILIFMIILILSNIIKNNFDNSCLKLIQLSAQTPSQMMGYILITPNNKVIVVDGGTEGDSEKLIKHINDYGGKVDYWFITHHHNDHAGAINYIIKNTDIEIKNIYVSLNQPEWYIENEYERSEFSLELINTLKNSRVKDRLIEPYINQYIKIDNNINVKILGIKNPEILQNCGNNQSMVFKVYTKNKSILFLGDTGKESEEKLLKNEYKDLKNDIVQMSHHGQNGATIDLYKMIDPKICLFPTQEWLWNNDNGQGYNSGPWTTLETRRWIEEELDVQEVYVSKDGEKEIIVK